MCDVSRGNLERIAGKVDRPKSPRLSGERNEEKRLWGLWIQVETRVDRMGYGIPYRRVGQAVIGLRLSEHITVKKTTDWTHETSVP